MAFRPGLAAASSRPSPSSSYLSPQGRAIICRATSTSTAATTAAADHANLLKKAATRAPGRPSPAACVAAITSLEKLKLKPAGEGEENEWARALGPTSPGRRWRLVFTAPKDKPKGFFVPDVVTACQRWDAEEQIIENGVYLGGILALVLKGCFRMEGKILRFDFLNCAVRVGPFKPTFIVKPESAREAVMSTVNTPERKALPYFAMIYVDDDLVVARGRSGGLAFWARTDPSFELSARIEGVD